MPTNMRRQPKFLPGSFTEGGLVFSPEVMKDRSTVLGIEMTARLPSGEHVGYIRAGECEVGEFAPIGRASIEPKHQGKGFYPIMLKKLRDVAKANGCKGIVSYGDEREGKQSTSSWEKFAKRDPQVKADRKRFGPTDFFLDGLKGLPKKGRIPLATVKRVMKKMPRKVSSCKITPAALREGMEIEREHRDVTRGSVLMTAKIAASHLCEDTRYYKKLKKYVE
jgi:hypothetical protein